MNIFSGTDVFISKYPSIILTFKAKKILNEFLIYKDINKNEDPKMSKEIFNIKATMADIDDIDTETKCSMELATNDK